MTGHTYFITGGCGFLGQYIVKALRDHDPGAELRVLDIRPRRTLLGIETMPGVTLLRGDLRKPETFIAGMAGVDTVVHCAGFISFIGGDAEAVCQSNSLGMQNVLRVALDRGCRNFLFISSISAIGMRPGQLSDETMVPDLAEKRLADPYGYSKLAGELALQAEARRIRGVILNPSVILGPGSSRIDRILALLSWIPCCPMIATLNSFVDVRDVATAAIFALERGRSGERYIVTATNIDNLTFISKVLAAMGRKVPVFAVPEGSLVLYDALVSLLDALRLNPSLQHLAGSAVDKAYSAAKIRREMDWQPAYSLEASLEHMIQTCILEERHESQRQERSAHRRIQGTGT